MLRSRLEQLDYPIFDLDLRDILYRAMSVEGRYLCNRIITGGIGSRIEQDSLIRKVVRSIPGSNSLDLWMCVNKQFTSDDGMFDNKSQLRDIWIRKLLMAKGKQLIDDGMFDNHSMHDRLWIFPSIAVLPNHRVILTGLYGKCIDQWDMCDLSVVVTDKLLSGQIRQSLQGHDTLVSWLVSNGYCVVDGDIAQANMLRDRWIKQVLYFNKGWH